LKTPLLDGDVIFSDLNATLAFHISSTNHKKLRSLKGDIYPVPRKGIITIGKSSACDIVITEDVKTISGMHCRIIVSDELMAVEDLR
jgi:predicted component of type VI protein secretion system